MIQAPPQKKKKRREKQTDRDILAHIFMAAWICVLLQGALRKWAFPSINAVYLIQDIPLLVAYLFAIWKGLVWGGKLAWTCIVVAIALSAETMLQLMFLNLSMRTAVVGLHHYIFYLPILFILPVCLNAKHRRRFIRFNLAVIIPMALLAALQSRAPKAAWINKTSAGDDTGFGIAEDTVRATGTFNFTLTYSVWCGFAVGLVMGEWLSAPEQRAFKSKIVLLLCTVSGVLATMVSGSRSAIMLAALGFVGGFAAVIVTRNVRLIVRFGGMLILLPILTAVAYVVVPKSFNAVIERFSGEGYQEDIKARIEHMFFGFLSVPQFSVLGKGVGYGIPAANPSAGATLGMILSEHESIRIVQEMGSFVGTALVILRYIAGVGLVFVSFKCLRLPRAHRLSHAVPLAFATAPTLMINEMVRSAPVLATQTFFVIALILSAVLFRDEPLVAGPSPMPQTR